jgi:hypothetical protein
VLDLADLLNLDLLGGLFLVRLDDKKIRMRAGFDLSAGSACAATIETLRLGGCSQLSACARRMAVNRFPIASSPWNR